MARRNLLISSNTLASQWLVGLWWHFQDTWVSTNFPGKGMGRLTKSCVFFSRWYHVPFSVSPGIPLYKVSFIRQKCNLEEKTGRSPCLSILHSYCKYWNICQHDPDPFSRCFDLHQKRDRQTLTSCYNDIVLHNLCYTITGVFLIDC